MTLACGFAILLADQWMKRTVRFVAHHSRAYERPLGFGLAWIFALASAALLYRTGNRFQSPMALAGLGLAFGGAASNFVDILRLRYVIDYIDLGWWPVFNLADAAIVGGIAAALLG